MGRPQYGGAPVRSASMENLVVGTVDASCAALDS